LVEWYGISPPKLSKSLGLINGNNTSIKDINLTDGIVGLVS
jgi:hypothetical protein